MSAQPAAFTAHTAYSPSSAVVPLPTRISRYRLSLQEVPVDFFADPDGQWEFSTLVEMAGFNPEHPGASVGALKEAFDGYPEGSAVIAEVGTECLYVAIAQLPSVPAEPCVQAVNPSRSVSAVQRRPLTAA